MSAGKNIEPIPRPVLIEDFYENLHRAYRSMRKAFARRSQLGTTQDEIAAKLNIDKSLVSKRLKGLENMTLKTLSQMASALSCRLIIDFEPYELVAGNNYYYRSSAQAVPQSKKAVQVARSHTPTMP